MERSGFFNSITQADGTEDREYTVNEFAEYFSTFIGNGVFIDPVSQLKVLATESWDIKLTPGKAYIDGYWYSLDEEKTFTLPANISGRPKTYAIECVLNRPDRAISSLLNVNYDPSTPLDTKNLHRLILALIEVSPTATSVYQRDIKDTRPFSEYCGYVHALVDQLNFDGMFIQFDDAFKTWFDEMKNQLSTDAAGNLQNQISTLKNDTLITEQTIQKYKNVGFTDMKVKLNK